MGNAKPRWKALVVDDERVARAAVAMALSQQGFDCCHAVDGEEAFQRVTSEPFDLIVTDLRMPRANGHHFASRVVKLKKRPLLVIHSCVSHAQLVEDLIRRGVDDIVFKPTNYAGFAAKMRAMVERKRRAQAATHGGDTTGGSKQSPRRMEPPSTIELPFSPVSKPDFVQGIDGVQNLLPVSTLASEIHQAATAEDLDLNKLVEQVQKDPALTVELLRMANSSHYRRSKRSTVEIEEAIVRVGVRKTGEIALSLSGLAAFREMIVPWINSDVLLMRASASAAALSLLGQEELDASGTDGGAAELCVQFYPLARLFLGVAFPDEYRHLISACAEQKVSLGRAEQLAFPESGAWALSHLLKCWQIPESVWEPLSYASSDYEELIELPAALRSHVERVKVAAFIGELAVGHWFHWDEIYPPPRHVLANHGIRDLPWLVDQCRKAMSQDSRFGNASNVTARSSSGGEKARTKVNYVAALPAAEDWLAILLETSGIDLLRIDPETIQRHDPALPIIINGAGLPSSETLDPALEKAESEVLLVTEPDHKVWLQSITRLAPLPVSHAWIAECCRFDDPAFV